MINSIFISQVYCCVTSVIDLCIFSLFHFADIVCMLPFCNLSYSQ